MRPKSDNPYTKPGSVKVSDVFADEDAICPFLPGGAFFSVEEMLASFDRPDQLMIIHGGKAICLKSEAIRKGYYCG